MFHLLLILCTCFFSSVIVTSTFNILPAAWLSDYDQKTPNILHENRINVKLWVVPLTVALSLCAYFITKNFTLNEALILFFVICLLIQISISDFLYMIIPDQHVVAIFILSALLISINGSIMLFSFHFIGALIGGGLYLLVSLISSIFKKYNSIGFGDIKLMASLGFLVGAYDILSIFVVTTFISTLFILIGLLFSKLSLHSFLPLAPFISIVFFLHISV